MRPMRAFLFASLIFLTACAQKAPATLDGVLTQASAEQNAASASLPVQTLTMSEIDALRNQLIRCVIRGKVNESFLKNTVDVRLVVSRDRRIKTATVVDQKRFNKDPDFRDAADFVIRALLSPHCARLNLPPDKYDMWKEMIVTFDPSDMTN